MKKRESQQVVALINDKIFLIIEGNISVVNVEVFTTVFSCPASSCQHDSFAEGFLFA